MNEGYTILKCNMHAAHLIKKNPYAFILLSVIAMRAKKSTNHPDKTIQIGEAFVGDFANYGMSEQNYRTAKKVLEANRIVTFKPTNKGTIAKIVNTDIYDVPTKTSTNKPTGSQRTTNGQLTTNKYVNKENKEINSPISPSVQEGEFILPDYIPITDWKDFCQMRGKGFTARAKSLILKELAELCKQGYDPGAVLQQSIKNGWKGVFPIHEQKRLVPAKPTKKAQVVVGSSDWEEEMKGVLGG